MTSTPAQVSKKDTIVIGASPPAALMIGFGYGSIAWGFYTDSTWLGLVSIFLGGIGLEMARLPSRKNKYTWHAAGTFLLGLAGATLTIFLFYTLLPDSIAFTFWGTVALHLALAYMLYLFTRRLLPVLPADEGKHASNR